jgi:hypothetical protein
MAENLNLNKEVFNKRAYLKTIDTSFKELGVKTIQEQIDIQPTVQEFFDMYNTLFYNINELGPTNSHEFLIKTSQEYIPPTPSPPTNEERVIEDFQKYPKSSNKKRAKRLNLLKVYIRAVKKKNNL